MTLSTPSMSTSPACRDICVSCWRPGLSRFDRTDSTGSIHCVPSLSASSRRGSQVIKDCGTQGLIDSARRSSEGGAQTPRAAIRRRNVTTKTPQASQAVIRLERRYEAAVEDLWYLWTTKEGFESWWGPEGFRVEVRKLDLHVGGELEYDMIAVAPEQIEFLRRANMPASHGTRGTFALITPFESLEIIHMIDFIQGMR